MKFLKLTAVLCVKKPPLSSSPQEMPHIQVLSSSYYHNKATMKKLQVHLGVLPSWIPFTEEDIYLFVCFEFWKLLKLIYSYFLQLIIMNIIWFYYYFCLSFLFSLFSLLLILIVISILLLAAKFTFWIFFSVTFFYF